eukprot:scaffold77762_cov49-Attheya_sp.AAC.3
MLGPTHTADAFTTTPSYSLQHTRQQQASFVAATRKSRPMALFQLQAVSENDSNSETKVPEDKSEDEEVQKLLAELKALNAQRAELFGSQQNKNRNNNNNNNNSGEAETEDAPKEGEPSLEQTARHLERLQQRPAERSSVERPDPTNDLYAVERKAHYDTFRQRPANDLKQELGKLRLKKTGRKPDLAWRLANHYVNMEFGPNSNPDRPAPTPEIPDEYNANDDDDVMLPARALLGGMVPTLSEAARKALSNAKFVEPTPIQRAALPVLMRGESAILHAATGSGKSLAYLLPITEALWRTHEEEGGDQIGIILTPTRELAAQVAGVATVLAPPGTVRLVSQPSNLAKPIHSNSVSEVSEFGGKLESDATSTKPRLIVGSAKAVWASLYGDGKVPGSPTSKPEAKGLLQSVRWLVFDEVDRILHVQTSRTQTRYKKHEKPAAILAAAVSRLTLGRAQVIGASATVGRPLRRELARVMGLPPDQCPSTIRGSSLEENNVDSDSMEDEVSEDDEKSDHVGRAVKIPSSVKHYVISVEEATTGQLLTMAARIAKAIVVEPAHVDKMLLVLSQKCGMNVQNTVGALKHFGVRPEPRDLLDALEATTVDALMDKHRSVSGATGVGQKTKSQQSYLLVTKEDSVRGLHLDGLQVVICVGRPNGPDEYTHIAGRTGRAGSNGIVINVVSEPQAAAFSSWQSMLGVQFTPLDLATISETIQFDPPQTEEEGEPIVS